MSRESTGVRACLIAVGLAIAAALVQTARFWAPPILIQFLAYLAAAALCAHFGVSLPLIGGRLPVGLLFALLGATDLNLWQTALLAGTVALADPAVKRRGWRWAALRVARLSGCALLAFWIYRHPAANTPSRQPAFLVLATLGYFFGDTLFRVARMLPASRHELRARIDGQVWAAPQYLVAAAGAALIHASNQALGWPTPALSVPLLYLVYRFSRRYLDRLEEEKVRASELADLHLRTITALAMAIDARDGTTHEHLRRVQVYAREIGKELGLSRADLKALEAASLLHDIGKLAVPEHIISKPGRLTPEEFEKMKIHPIVGAEILESVRFPYPVVPVVLAHHEKWNGSGYPHGLRGEEIPAGARILAAVDCLDALASDRQYRRAIPLREAMDRVSAESGEAFDPLVIQVLERRYEDLERVARSGSSGLGRPIAPLRVKNGAASGAGFEHVPARAPAPPEHDFIATIAAARQEFQTLLEITHDLGSSLSVEETLALLTSRLKNSVPFDAVAIYVVKGQRLAAQFASGEDAALFSRLEMPLGEGLSGWVAQNSRPIVNGNPSVESGYMRAAARFSTLLSALSVPLPGTSGVIGVLTLYHRERDAFSRDHLRILLTISHKAGLTIENALRFHQVQKSAVTDELTGLPNARSLFLRLEAELSRCRRTGDTLAILVLDMDGFKQVNDRFGHMAGNRLLRQAGASLREACREYDYVARMGGDEFVVLMPGIRGEDLAQRARQLQDAVAVAGRSVRGCDGVGLSIGVAVCPDDGEDAQELLVAADSRMYEMKHAHNSRRNSSAVPVEDWMALVGSPEGIEGIPPAKDATELPGSADI